MANRWGKMETVTDFIFLGSKITVDGDWSHEIRRCWLLGRKAMTNLGNVLKSKDIILPTKVHIVKAMVFFSSHVQMWELDHKGCALKNWCFQIVLEKTLDSALDCKVFKPVNPKGNQPWLFIRTVREAPILWPPGTKSRLTGEDPYAGKDWRQKEKRAAEDEVVGWHHWLNEHEFEQTQGDNEGQGSLAHCSSWGCKKPNMT